MAVKMDILTRWEVGLIKVLMGSLPHSLTRKPSRGRVVLFVSKILTTTTASELTLSTLLHLSLSQFYFLMARHACPANPCRMLNRCRERNLLFIQVSRFYTLTPEEEVKRKLISSQKLTLLLNNEGSKLAIT